jgi:dethiobiotin synthetase
MTQKQFCIIGTDTGIGKTYITCSLLRHLSNQNKKVAALKPIASGLTQIDNQLINEDVAKLIRATNTPQTAHDINPICYPDAVAPHIAAKIITNNSHQSFNKKNLYLTTTSPQSALNLDNIINATYATINNTKYDYLLSKDN